MQRWRRTQMAHLGAGLWLAFGAAAVSASPVVVRELMFAPSADRPEFVVIENRSATPFDIAGWRFTDGIHYTFPDFSPDAPEASFLRAHEAIVIASELPAVTRAAYRIPADVRVLGPWTGELADTGERVALVNRNGGAVCSVAYGVGSRWPDPPIGRGHSFVLIRPDTAPGNPANWAASAQPVTILDPRQPRAVATASARLDERPQQTNVLITEIMYDPPEDNAAGEFIELFNRGTEAVDLGGWRFTDGIEFTVPAGTRLPPGGYAVVARSSSWIRDAYGPVPLLGSFKGRLDNDGETIGLVDAAGNLAARVRYAVGGGWPERAHGGGSSLELRHPDLDPQFASAWRASDSPARASLRGYACTNRWIPWHAEGTPADYRELHLWLAGAGHAVLEALELHEPGGAATNLLPAIPRVSTDGSGASGWLCVGTHANSHVADGQLHLVADGPGDHLGNHVEIDVPGLQAGKTYALRFRARWVWGTPRLLAQSWDGSFAASFRLDIPQALGSPGRPNPGALPAPVPQITELRHDPAVPKPTDTIRVTARIRSPIPLAAVELCHRADAFPNPKPWTRTGMARVNEPAEALSSAGSLFTAELRSPHPAGEVIAYYLHVQDRAGDSAFAPDPGADQPALLVVDPQTVPKDLRSVRVIVGARELDALTNGTRASHRWQFPRSSKHYFPASVIWNETAVVPGARVRNSGSVAQRTGDLRKARLQVPQTHAFREHTEWVYDDDAASGRAYHNRLARYLLDRLGQPTSENEFVRFIVNAGPPVLREEVEPIGPEFLRRHFPDGNHGELYRVELEWRLLDDGTVAVAEDATWNSPLPPEPGRYRATWIKRTRVAEDDYSGLLALFAALARTNSAPAEVDALLDADAVLAVAAVRGYVGDWDNFTLLRGRNGYLYRPSDAGRFRLLHWDGDESFVTSQPFYGKLIAPWLEQSAHRERFVRYVDEVNRMCTQDALRLTTWLRLERQATGNAVLQAAYTNYFRLRAEEWRDRRP